MAIVVLALLLANCGGDEPAPAPDAGDDSVLIAALGDSITAGSPLWDPDPAVRDRIGPALDARSQF